MPVEKVYEFDPITTELTAEEAKHVLGAQGQLWAEYLPSPGNVEYMAFPRLTALSEVVWTPKEKKDLTNFLTRMGAQEQRLRNLEVNFKPIKKPSTPEATR